MQHEEAPGNQSEPESGPETRPRKRNTAKSAMACDRCRLKKIKCDGSRPCGSCVVGAPTHVMEHNDLPKDTD